MLDNHVFSFLCALLILMPMGASAKTASTVYTLERLANARRNIERHEWARAIRDKAISEAEVFAAQSDEFLWELVTPQSIPRGIEVSMPKGCPNCGKAIDKFGNYPWKCDVIAKPWKVECPSCGEVFPKNDFARYYESGKDERGVFDPDRADPTLLFNTDHPDASDPLHTYGVDDGLGWKDHQGNPFRFIGYYGHYGSWAAILSALRSLRDAYVYTGDARYAQKATVLLYRVAEFYPSMDYSKWARLGFFNSDGGSGKGKVYGRIWETGVANTLVSAYDAVYPGLDNAEALAFISARAGRPVTVSDLRALVERNIVREVHDGILRGDIAGNEGMHQYAMALAAIVLDDPETTGKWLDWVFAPGDARTGNTSGGNVLGIFADKIDDDGMGNEASPAYNAIWRTRLRALADLLALYPRYRGPVITELPKYRRMFETPVRLICLGNYIPIIGDTGKTGAPGTGDIGVEELAYAFRTFRDPRLAQMAAYLNGGKTEGIHLDIFDPDPEGVASEIAAAVREHGPYAPQTEEMPSYGLAILRGGKGENQRALSIYYGRNTGHGHRDTLNIELFAFGLDLMPDLGYPEYATAWPSRYEWNGHTISHNTVVVDRARQADNRLGVARFVKESNGVSAAEVYAGKPYPQAYLYQRTVAMVDVSETDFYVVDIFRVKGGEEHVYSFHGPEGEIETEALDLIAQGKGTLAGENIDFGADLGGRETGWKDSTGYQYLYDVRRNPKPSPQFAVTWKARDTWKVLGKPRNIRLRVNVLSPPGEVILAHGDPPQNKPGNPRRLEYLLLPHQGDSSTYVTVIEPCEGRRSISKIERLDDGDCVTVRVTLASGRVDYIASSTERTRRNLGGRAVVGRFAAVTRQAGRSETLLLVE